MLCGVVGRIVEPERLGLFTCQLWSLEVLPSWKVQ
jgi:hypothetical protein